ncbi:hypothetical protein ACFO0N_01155 [Halobium salinum]|uniref:Uncharacterized protein n=1 Tax=Halobium salinum TaxID=1364940 RepID=A0ABD5P6V0_9EURY|nr:hypothetical protein [Halobium salinum]
MMVNNATQTETFTVGVVEVGNNLTVQDGDGDSFNYTINQGSSTYTTSNASSFTHIDFPESASRHGEYTLQPGERKQIDVEGVAPNKAIVVLVYDEDDGTYRSIKTLSCSGAIQGYRVTSQKGGSDDWTMSTHQCSNW